MWRHLRLLQVGRNGLVFRSSGFKRRLHEGLCSATSGCDKSDVASRCLQIQGLRQGCTRAYVAPVKVITGRM